MDMGKTILKIVSQCILVVSTDKDVTAWDTVVAFEVPADKITCFV